MGVTVSCRTWDHLLVRRDRGLSLQFLHEVTSLVLKREVVVYPRLPFVFYKCPNLEYKTKPVLQQILFVEKRIDFSYRDDSHSIASIAR